MNTPNPELMHLYGTDEFYLAKVGSIPTAGRLLAGAAWMGASHLEAQRVDRMLAEAEAMNEELRMRQHERMAPVIAGFKGASAVPPHFLELVKVADAIGRAVAGEFIKQSLALPGTARLLQAAGKEGIQGVAKPGLVDRAKAVLSPNARFNQAIKAEGLAPPAAALPKPVIAPKPTPAAPAAAPAAKSKPLIGLGTKAKLLGAAGIAGVGYAGYKGLQGASDFMMQPGHSSEWGMTGHIPRAGVNQYGYPQ